MTRPEKSPIAPRDVFAAFSCEMKIASAARIALAVTVVIVSFPWLMAMLERHEPWGRHDYAPMPADLALLLVRLMPVLAALVVLVGTVIATARASTAPGRVLACIGGAFTLVVLPLLVSVAADDWGRVPKAHPDGLDAIGEMGAGLIVIVGIAGGAVAAVFVGGPVSVLGVWALHAERQPSVDRLWRYGRAAAVLIAAVVGAEAVLESYVFADRSLFGAVHGFAACGALIVAAIFSERMRRMRRWLAAVRAGRVSGWRVRALGPGEDIARPLIPFVAGDGMNGVLEMVEDAPPGRPYRDVPLRGEPVAFTTA